MRETKAGARGSRGSRWEERLNWRDRERRKATGGRSGALSVRESEKPGHRDSGRRGGRPGPQGLGGAQTWEQGVGEGMKPAGGRRGQRLGDTKGAPERRQTQRIGESRAGQTDSPAMRVSAGGSAERSGEEAENLSPEEPQL